MNVITAKFRTLTDARNATRLLTFHRRLRALCIPGMQYGCRVEFTCKDQHAVDAVLLVFGTDQSIPGPRARGFEIVEVPEQPKRDVSKAQTADVLAACPVTAEDYAKRIGRPVGAVECGLDRLVADGVLERLGKTYIRSGGTGRVAA